MRVHHEGDSCCHVLSVFLMKEFNKQLACTIEDIIEKVRTSETYPIPMQADRLCDLAEEVSTRTKMLFLRDKEIPEKSWIVLDIDTLLSKINGRIFAPETLPEHCLTPTHTGVLPWSQIQRHLPDFDPSLVVSFLGRLEFCQVIQDPEVLSLIKFGNIDTSSMIDSDEETTSPVSSHQQSLCSQMSTSTAAGSGMVSKHYGYPPSLSRREFHHPNWLYNPYSTNTSPQGYSDGVSNHTHESKLSLSSGLSSTPTYTAGGSVLSEQGAILPSHNWGADFYSPNTDQPPQHQTCTDSNPSSSSSNQTAISEQNTHIPLPPAISTKTMERHDHSSDQWNSNTEDASHRLQDTSLHPHDQHPMQVSHQEYTTMNTAIEQALYHKQLFQSLNVPKPAIITSSSLPTPSVSQLFSPPAVSGTGVLLSPFNTKLPVHHDPSIVSHSLPNCSEYCTQASKLHENLHLERAPGGSQPPLPEEQAQLAAGSRLYGSMHRSPSDSCTLLSGQQRKCNTHPQKDVSPRMSSNILGHAQNSDLLNDKFLFFPGLVNSGQPSGEVWLKDESFVFYSGWCLESAQPHKFFTPRFLQTLILRLAFGFAISRRPSDVFTSSLSLFSRECTIWKSGLRWLNLDGVETFVEMVEDGRALLLLMRAKKGSELRGVNLRSLLIRKILETKEECCPVMQTTEYFIHPKHLREQENYPIITSRLDSLTRYDVGIIATAINANQRRLRCKLQFRFAYLTIDHIYVVYMIHDLTYCSIAPKMLFFSSTDRYVIDIGSTNIESLTTIIYFDPYMYLKKDTLQRLFDQESQDEDLTEDLIFDFSISYYDAADTFQEILTKGYHG